MFDAEPGTPEDDHLDVLVTLIEAYEERHWSIDAPDPIDAIHVRMAEENLRPRDLEVMIGLQGRVSEPPLDRGEAGAERMLRQQRAQNALASIRQRAREMGLDQLTDDEIQAEIKAARAECRA